jgi:hypothetical protein
MIAIRYRRLTACQSVLKVRWGRTCRILCGSFQFPDRPVNFDDIVMIANDPLEVTYAPDGAGAQNLLRYF